ncbi:MAG: EscU/YscU/HrcU family type III secretion system export apparatus switch protein [Bacillota bacterium]
MNKKEPPRERSRDAAAALKYNRENDRAPVVVAVGKGDLAEKIREIAEKENVPIYRDSVLAQALVQLGAGVEIPPHLYNTVAQVLVHIARLDKKLGKNP